VKYIHFARGGGGSVSFGTFKYQPAFSPAIAVLKPWVMRWVGLG
jgi:hypothetical protein